MTTPHDATPEECAAFVRAGIAEALTAGPEAQRRAALYLGLLSASTEPCTVDHVTYPAATLLALSAELRRLADTPRA